MILVRKLFLVAITLAIGGFLGCVLTRYAPGFQEDERELDPRYSSATLQALRQERAGEQNVLRFYVRYLAAAARGDFGTSRAFNVPVGGLIQARAGATFRLAAAGLFWGWVAGLLLGASAALVPRWPMVLFTETCSSLFLCLPAAVLALLAFLASVPAPLVIAAALFPRVYRYTAALLAESLSQPRVMAAAARGIPPSRLFFRYAIPPLLGPMAAFLGVCVTLAFGACIPVEVILDVPGLGQLAWKAALARDLPLLAAMTLLVTGVTLTANTLSDLAS